VVDDLDLVGAGPEARQGIDKPLQPIVVPDDLLGSAFRERVRLVVENERPSPGPVQDIETAVQQDTVLLEGEGHLDLRSVERTNTRRELRLTIRGDEATDLLDLVVGCRRIQIADRRGELIALKRAWRSQVDLLQEHVHRIADLRRRQSSGPIDATAPFDGAETDDPLRVEPVRAALVEGERAVGKPPHAVERRARHGHELGELRRGAGRQRAVLAREEGELLLVVE
jgi:hypothetical protein